MQALNYVSWDSPIGLIRLVSVDEKLIMCDWIDSHHHQSKFDKFKKIIGLNSIESESTVIIKTKTQILEYLNGQRQTFDIPLHFIGTDLQRAVADELQKIPYGQTISYSELANRIGRPTATRAVANAVGYNPISILIPCHRIIGSNGSLTGYGGGLDRKRKFLAIEGLSYLH